MPTLTKALKREIAALATGKGRRRSGAFMAEGTKCVLDTIDHFALRHLVATETWLAEHPFAESFSDKIIIAGRGEIGEMTTMSLAPDVIAVYDLPEAHVFEPKELQNRLVVALDRIQDPGNLGTIMRTADWMGITTILASIETVDCYNPKVVQATMGAISRVKIIYGNLPEMLRALPDSIVYGTFLDGENIYTAKLSDSGIVVMGNEGQGISNEVAACVNRRLLIPAHPTSTSESLNVATATAITLSQFISRSYGKN